MWCEKLVHTPGCQPAKIAILRPVLADSPAISGAGRLTVLQPPEGTITADNLTAKKPHSVNLHRNAPVAVEIYHNRLFCDIF